MTPRVATGGMGHARLARQSGLGMAPLLSTLLEMELKGLIKQLPGKCFIRKPIS